MEDQELSITKKLITTRSLFDVFWTATAFLCMLCTVVPLFAVLFFVGYSGVRRIDYPLFTQLSPPPGYSEGGIAHAILGTLLTVGIGSLIAIPIGIFAAIYLAEFSGNNKIAYWVRFTASVLSGVPSILIGVFIYGLLIATKIIGFSAIAGGTALSVLMLPTITKTTDEALQIVPQDLRWAALGIGAYNYQAVLGVILPAAAPTIVTGITLAIARAAGETAPLLFTALYSNFWASNPPEGLIEPIATLSVLIYNFSVVPFEPQKQLAWSASLILVFLVLITSIASRLATREKTH
ncbi:phosphate ABC transporter permease PstA [Candidatus Atelocyanobacterium thalassae]|uniref:Phosphate transport system permease protein PstA n=1 Tax=Atelocyanobacterium thalassa (isolate ALOHA) TaxID=1453429 RepID=D3ENV0_ATETH|nr:phosphate ABC transporter permease PstA [Candidatus Atelocyanobacterium thalassa]ADB95150.1 phosphate ABC transporter membrane protein 2, pstA [Candidatus Atelocyanobacterium thalassa isolate ALOHA]MCH2543160.1 phosphate ABC transporter permease PstA [Candidatus Atelocyanobacterium sp. ALOHA_A2.5_9]|tara:strand:- start:13943 stop:14824 length:882 start_codon:yes stop_codon:yes gene_type:complete